jgi:cobalamin biosynthesis Mg chelatase CobN
VRAVLLLGALLLAIGVPAHSASAAPPCWKVLLTDWYDGSIDKTYPIPCYQQAVAHLPTDAQLYSSAKDDILRAMARAVAAQHQAATPVTTTAATTAASSVPADTTPTTTTAETTTAAAVTPPPATTTTASPGRTPPKGIAGSLDKLNPGAADSFPLPLLILGTLAVLLVLAGVGGMLWRRREGTDTGPTAT